MRREPISRHEAFGKGAAAVRGPPEPEAIPDARHVGSGGFVSDGATDLVASRPLSPEAQLRREQRAVIAHELRNSLALIGAAVRSLCAQQARTAAVARARLLVERQIAQAARLIEDLLADGACSQPGWNALQRRRIDLRILLRETIEGAELEFFGRGQRLTAALPDDPVYTVGDPGRLGQVFANLLNNAAKYTGDGGDIAVSLEREDEYACVRIRDSGVGIAPEVLPSVFQLFVQAEPSARRFAAGHGIGLAVVRSLVELHGGRVTASSAGVGQGSEFTVRLPASPA